MVFIVTLNTFGYSVISSVHALYACQYALCTQIHLLIHLFTCRGDWDVWVNLQEKHWDTGIHDELYSLLLLLFYECIHQISITVFLPPCRWDLLGPVQSHRHLSSLYRVHWAHAHGNPMHRLKWRSVRVWLRLLHEWPDRQLRAVHSLSTWSGGLHALWA